MDRLFGTVIIQSLESSSALWSADVLYSRYDVYDDFPLSGPPRPGRIEFRSRVYMPPTPLIMIAGESFRPWREECKKRPSGSGQLLPPFPPPPTREVITLVDLQVFLYEVIIAVITRSPDMKTRLASKNKRRVLTSGRRCKKTKGFRTLVRRSSSHSSDLANRNFKVCINVNQGKLSLSTCSSQNLRLVQILEHRHGSLR